jgi:hypothetical protein
LAAHQTLQDRGSFSARSFITCSETKVRVNCRNLPASIYATHANPVAGRYMKRFVYEVKTILQLLPETFIHLRHLRLNVAAVNQTFEYTCADSDVLKSLVHFRLCEFRVITSLCP